jgi:hypothetical protein
MASSGRSDRPGILLTTVVAEIEPRAEAGAFPEPISVGLRWVEAAFAVGAMMEDDAEDKVEYASAKDLVLVVDPK